MKVGHFGIAVCAIAGLLVSVGSLPSSGVLAQDHAASHRDQTSAFVRLIREATAKFRDVEVAEAAGYALAFGCVTGDGFGAMGMHFVNMPLVMDGKLNPAEPEIVIYEPLPNGRLKLIGVDYLIDKVQWHTNNPTLGTPELGGQLLHLFTAPNRFGLADFYTLHVWAWKENPTGMFTNWHANVSCESFSGR
jgi:hypothetical protein